MNYKGFTLFELLITLSIVSIVLVIGIPSLSSQIHNTKLKTATQSLLEAVEFTRTKAVFSNRRATIRHTGSWADGWEIFIDTNNDGLRNENEPLIQAHERLEDVLIFPNEPLEDYISFIANGQGRKVGHGNGGAMQMGHITLCPKQYGNGYQLWLSSGGRMRVANVTAAQCQELQ